MKSDFYILMSREISIGIKNFFVLYTFASFFIISILIFVFAIGSDLIAKNNIYEPIIWVLLIFSVMLVSENFVSNDCNDGSLKELQFLGYNEELIILCKSITMWIMILLPMIALMPIVSIFFKIDYVDIFYLFINFLFATPSLVLLSLVSSLFSMQLKRNKIIQFIIILPFYIPIIIFTSSSKKFALENNLYNNNFLILIGIFFITLPLCLYTSRLIMKEINK